MDDLLELTRRAEATHFWFRGFRQFVSPLIAHLAAGRRNLRLIDCGCGTGHNLRLLTPYGRAVGFDVTHGGSIATRRSGCPAAQADITRIPFASGVFDVATAFDVLQCIEADGDALSEMARIIKPGGAVVLSLAALDVLRGDHAEAWHEVRRYTPSSARRLIERAGLHPERVSYMFASTFPLMLAVRTGQRMLRPFRALRPDTDIVVPSAPVNTVLTALVSVEAALAKRVAMPIGSSLLVVGRKPIGER